MNTVTMGLDVLKEEMTGKNESKETLDTIDDMIVSCDASVNILSNILTNDKLESSSLQLEKEEHSALKLIRDTIKPFQMQVLRYIFPIIHSYVFLLKSNANILNRPVKKRLN